MLEWGEYTGTAWLIDTSSTLRLYNIVITICWHGVSTPGGSLSTLRVITSPYKRISAMLEWGEYRVQPG
jgi:hypothetical protein